MGLIFPTLWIKAIMESLSEKDKTSWKIFIIVVKTVMISSCLIVVFQQLLLFNATWNDKITEYENKIKEYDIHRCATMRTTNIQFIEECDRLAVIIRTSPMMRALTKVAYGWNSCLTMPCTQLAHTIANSTEYKLLFLLVSFGTLYYLYQFLVMTREKTNDIKERIRAKSTMKYVQKQQQLLRQEQQDNPFLYGKCNPYTTDCQ